MNGLEGAVDVPVSAASVAVDEEQFADSRCVAAAVKNDIEPHRLRGIVVLLERPDRTVEPSHRRQR